MPEADLSGPSLLHRVALATFSSLGLGGPKGALEAFLEDILSFPQDRLLPQRTLLTTLGVSTRALGTPGARADGH